MNRQRLAGAIALMGASLIAVSAAWADVTVTAETTITGSPPGARGNAGSQADGKPHPTTTYYKGQKQRVETGDTVTITDFESGKSFVLDTTKKTYVVRDISKAVANPFLDQMKVELAADVKATDEKKTIAEKAAKRYDYNATFKMTADDPQISAFLPTIVITGEQWATEDVAFPVDVKKYANANLLRSAPPMMAKSIKEMSEKLAIVKGLPLSSIVTVKFVLPKTAPAEFAARMPKDPIVTTTEVKTITEGPLDDTLFAAPSDYKETKEAAPTFGPSGPDGPQ